MHPMKRLAVHAVAVLALSAVAGPPAAGAETGAVHAPRLPDEVAGLAAVAEEDAAYTRETIYSYLDGGAEVYLAYGMVSCRARRYEGEGRSVILDLFDMGSVDGAYGVFTHDQDGEEVDVGQAGLLRAGWLSAWHGRFFVSLFAESAPDAVRPAMLALGRAVAAVLGPPGPVPALMRALPAEGRVARSARYLRDPLPLRAVLDLGEGDVLRLGEGTFAALAGYRRGGEAATLLVVEYPTLAVASEVEGEVRAVLAGRAAAVGRRGARLALAVGEAVGALPAALAAEVLPAEGPDGGRPR